MNNSAKKYLKLVKKEIPWHGKPRRDFIKLMKNDVEEYCIDHLNPVIDDLVDEFGEPRKVAKEFVQEIDLDILKRSANISAVIKFVLIATLLFFIAFYTVTYLTAPTMTNGYFEEEIVIIPENIYE